MSTSDLLDTVHNAPDLPGALCVGRAELFDAVEDPGMVDAAISLCLQCPAYTACREWAASLPESAVHGVLAGRVHEWRSPSQRWRHQRKEASGKGVRGGGG